MLGEVTACEWDGGLLIVLSCNVMVPDHNSIFLANTFDEFIL